MLSQIASTLRPSGPHRYDVGTATWSGDRKSRSPALAVDLGNYPVSRLMARRPVELDAAGPGAITELRFPPGMEQLPEWVREATPAVIRLPDYQGRDVAIRHPMTLLEVGGRKVRSISTRDSCSVSVPDADHRRPVHVEWVDSRGRVVRTGHPQDHVNRAAREPSDAAMPRNGCVNFSTPWYEGELIYCRQIAAALDDHETSADDSGSEAAGAGRKPASAVDKHAAYARRKFASPSALQAAIPRSYDSRFYDLISRSRGATVVENQVFGEWAAAQFKHMRVPDKRTYLLCTKDHVMNFALSTRIGPTGMPVYTVILKDPNRLAAPSSLETSDPTDLPKHLLGRLVDPKLKALYFPVSDDGVDANTVLVARTPRGNAKTVVDASQVGLRREPRLRFFPKSLIAGRDDLRFNGELGSYLTRTYSQLAGLPPGEAFERLAQKGQIACRFVNGDASQITEFFALVDRLLRAGQLTSRQAVVLIRLYDGEYAAVRAVVEGRPDALERYTDGLRAMIDEGTVTAQYNGRFESLFSDYATEVMDTLPSSGTPLQKEAAQRYAALQRLVDERLNQAATALVTRL